MRQSLVRLAARVAWAAALLALGLAAASGVAAAKTTDYHKAIALGRELATAALQESDASSISVAFVAGDKTVWQETFGYADVAAQKAPRADTMYGIGSVSKVIAAAAVMKLVDQGKVDLDAPVVAYVPAFRMASPAYADITVRMTIDHSSGLPGSDFTNWSTAEYFPGYLQQFLDTAATQRLKATPGLYSVYCNDGFNLAELVVAAASGKSYAEFVQDELFAPLGMRHSTFPIEPYVEGTYAHSYAADGSVRPRESVNLLAAGGAWSTPSDMVRFARMLMDGGTLDGVRVLSAASVAEMAADQTLGDFDPAPSRMMRFGLGWDSVSEPALAAAGVTAWAKNGGSDQYGGSLLVAPKARLAIMVSGAPVVTYWLDGLAREVLLTALKEQGTIRRLPPEAPAVAPSQKTATAAQLQAMTGTWASFEHVLRITPTPGDAQALTTESLTDGQWIQVGSDFTLRRDGRFHRGTNPLGYRPVHAGNRDYLVVTFTGHDGYSTTELLAYQRVGARAPLSAAWQARAGRTWVVVNERPDSSTYDSTGPTLNVWGVPGLPGYVGVSVPMYGAVQIHDAAQDDDAARLFLQLPGNYGREQEDLVVERRGGEEWMHWASSLYRPLDTVPALTASTDTVTIGTDGYAEWRAVTAGATLRIAGATAWYLYGADFAKLAKGEPAAAGGGPAAADVSAPAGSHLVVFGPAGATVTVTTAPAD